LYAEELSGRPITVGQPLPWGAGRRTFDWLFTALPVLPEDLEYRLADEREAAERDAMHVPGITRVDNRIEVAWSDESGDEDEIY
jgi:hypothetical protein